VLGYSTASFAYSIEKTYYNEKPTRKILNFDPVLYAAFSSKDPLLSKLRKKLSLKKTDKLQLSQSRKNRNLFVVKVKKSKRGLVSGNLISFKISFKRNRNRLIILPEKLKVTFLNMKSQTSFSSSFLYYALKKQSKSPFKLLSALKLVQVPTIKNKKVFSISIFWNQKLWSVLNQGKASFLDGALNASPPGVLPRETLKTPFEENIEYLLGGWDTNLNLIRVYSGYYYDKTSKNWTFAPDSKTYPVATENPSDAAYSAAYRITPLVNVAMRLNDLEKIEILAKLYLAYESRFITLADMRARVLESQAFLSRVDAQFGGNSNLMLLKQVIEAGLTPSNYIIGIPDYQTLDIAKVKAIIAKLDDYLNGTPDSEVATRAEVTEALAFIEEFEKHHYGFTEHSTLGFMRSSRKINWWPALISRIGNNYTWEQAKKTVDLWRRRFKSMGEQSLLIIPWNNPIGYSYPDNMKSTMQVSSPAADLIKYISNLPESKRTESMKLFVSHWTKIIIQDEIIPALRERYILNRTFDQKLNLHETWQNIIAFRGNPETSTDIAWKDWWMWLLKQSTVMLSSNHSAPDLVVISPEDKQFLLTTLETGLDLFELKLTFVPGTRDRDGNIVGSYIFDKDGWWSDQWVEGTGALDISHWSWRFAKFAAALLENLSEAGLANRLPGFEQDVNLLVNHFVYVCAVSDSAEGVNQPLWLFTNYLDGTNGGYRDGHETAPEGGFGPFGLSHIALLGWGPLASTHLGLNKLIYDIMNVATSKDAAVAKWRNDHYGGLRLYDEKGNVQYLGPLLIFLGSMR